MHARILEEVRLCIYKFNLEYVFNLYLNANEISNLLLIQLSDLISNPENL